MSYIKRSIANKARLINGMLSVLRDDIRYLKQCTDEYDLISISDAIKDTKDTIQVLQDNLVELEYIIYLMDKEYF